MLLFFIFARPEHRASWHRFAPARIPGDQARRMASPYIRTRTVRRMIRHATQKARTVGGVLRTTHKDYRAWVPSPGHGARGPCCTTPTGCHSLSGRDCEGPAVGAQPPDHHRPVKPPFGWSMRRSGTWTQSMKCVPSACSMLRISTRKQGATLPTVPKLGHFLWGRWRASKRLFTSPMM